MCMLAPFDTLAYARRLRAAGFPEAQAEALTEAHAGAFADLIETRYATKNDVKHAVTDLKTWLLRAQAVVVGILATLMKLFG